MKFGWPISFLAHGFAGVAMLVGFSAVDTIESQEKILEIHIASIDELTNVRASVKKTDPEAEPVPEEIPMTLQTPLENAPEEGAPEERSVETESVPVINLNSEDEAEIVSEDKDPKVVEFDIKRIEELVNRSSESQPISGQQRTLVSEQNFYIYSENAQAAAGAGTAMTISELDALRQAMYQCWRIPADATNAHELVVKVRVRLRLDGTVKDAYIENTRQVDRSSNPFMAKAAREAVNAVKKCSPYDFLAQEKYSSWQDMLLTFIPEV